MFNDLGIFSNNLIQVLRPGINLRRRPLVRTIQLAGRRGGVSTIGGGIPVPLVPGDIVTARSQVLQGTMTVTNRTLSLLQVP